MHSHLPEHNQQHIYRGFQIQYLQKEKQPLQNKRNLLKVKHCIKNATYSQVYSLSFSAVSSLQAS